jgi:hypothetical protein
MAAISTYTQYLPVTLWSASGDPTRLLARMLRVPEKILTGIPIDTTAARPMATIVNAAAGIIRVNGDAQAARFRVGDVITVQGTIERQAISQIVENELWLAASLTGTYNGGTVRLADLRTGDVTFRIDDDTAIGPGSLVIVEQGLARDEVQVLDLAGGFITLTSGLSNGYSLATTAVPVSIRERVPIVHGSHTHTDLEERIDRLHDVFSPWRTETRFLPWLASWMALVLQQSWTEYQQRELIARMSQIYLQRGLKRGLHTYLDIWAFDASGPRIAVDDGDAVFRARRGDEGAYTLHPIVQSHTVSPAADAPATVSVLLHPTAIAIDSSNAYFVADEGDRSLNVPRPAALWKMTSTADVPYALAGTRPMPQPLYVGKNLEWPVALVVDSTNRCSVIDVGPVTSALSQAATIMRFAPPNYPAAVVISATGTPALTAVRPVDMTLSSAGAFVVLDRGGHLIGDPPAGQAFPKIHVVTEGPLAVSTINLTGIEDPTAIVAEPAGTFIVADARTQTTNAPARLLRLNPAAGWTATSLLDLVAWNPLVRPTGMVFESPQVLLLCDTGVRFGYDPADPQGADSAYRYVAEPAALYRVDLTQNPPVITRASGIRQLVSPTKLALDRDRHPIITDRGEALRGAPSRNWRAGAAEFGATVLFSRQRPTALAGRNRVRIGIMSVIEQEKPAHTAWAIDY